MPEQQPTILLVEDDPLVRELTIEALTDAGYVATAVYHPDAVPWALRETPATLILADSAGAGSGDVWPALDAVRVAAGATPVLIFSAHPPARFVGYARRGFAGVVTKPFLIDDLLTAVRAALAGTDDARTERPFLARARRLFGGDA